MSSDNALQHVLGMDRQRVQITNSLSLKLFELVESPLNLQQLALNMHSEEVLIENSCSFKDLECSQIP